MRCRLPGVMKECFFSHFKIVVLFPFASSFFLSLLLFGDWFMSLVDVQSCCWSRGWTLMISIYYSVLCLQASCYIAFARIEESEPCIFTMIFANNLFKCCIECRQPDAEIQTPFFSLIKSTLWCRKKTS